MTLELLAFHRTQLHNPDPEPEQKPVDSLGLMTLKPRQMQVK